MIEFTWANRPKWFDSKVDMELWFAGFGRELDAFEKELREIMQQQDKQLSKVPKSLRSKTHGILIEQVLGEECQCGKAKKP